MEEGLTSISRPVGQWTISVHDKKNQTHQLTNVTLRSHIFNILRKVPYRFTKFLRKYLSKKGQ